MMLLIVGRTTFKLLVQLGGGGGCGRQGLGHKVGSSLKDEVWLEADRHTPGQQSLGNMIHPVNTKPRLAKYLFTNSKV